MKGSKLSGVVEAKSVWCLLMATVFISLNLLADEEPVRRFTNQQGVVIEAQIVAVKDETAVLLWKGKEAEVPLASLTAADQKWIAEWLANREAKMKGDTAEQPAAPGEADPRAGQTLNFKFPELIKDFGGNPAEMNVKVPAGFSTGKPVPLFIFLAGGKGSNSPGGASGLTKDDFLCVGLPYPDDGRNPVQDNMVGSFDEVWDYWQPMLAKLDEEFPNIDPRLRMIGGFSNGGHAIDGLLGETAFAEYFNAFILVDGGGSLGGKYRSSKGEHAYVAWGEKSPNAANSEEVVSRVRRSGMDYVASEMKDVGHAFPESEKSKVRDWIYQTVLPSLDAAAE